MTIISLDPNFIVKNKNPQVESIILYGYNLIFVPYLHCHIRTYHKWMSNPTLLETTNSLPMSLENEIKIQKPWRENSKKCTFILLINELCSNELKSYKNGHIVVNEVMLDIRGLEPNDNKVVIENVHAMTGDINLFLSTIDDSSSCANNDSHESNTIRSVKTPQHRQQAEISIMIANENYQRKRYGTEAVCLIMIYGIQKLDIKRYFVKIHVNNIASRHLFEDKIGFKICKYLPCFKEIELQFVKDNVDDMLRDLWDVMKILF